MTVKIRNIATSISVVVIGGLLSCHVYASAKDAHYVDTFEQPPQMVAGPEGSGMDGGPQGPSMSGGPQGPSMSGGPQGPSMSGGPQGPSMSGGPQGPSMSGGPQGPSMSGDSQASGGFHDDGGSLKMGPSVAQPQQPAQQEMNTPGMQRNPNDSSNMPKPDEMR